MNPSDDTASPVALSRNPLRRVFSHPAILLVAIGAAITAIHLMNRYLPDTLAVLLIDRYQATYPLTVQNVMWVVFAIGLAELVNRQRDAMAERRQLRLAWLPEDETTILQGPELRRIYAATRPTEWKVNRTLRSSGAGPTSGSVRTANVAYTAA